MKTADAQKSYLVYLLALKNKKKTLENPVIISPLQNACFINPGPYKYDLVSRQTDTLLEFV